MAFAGHCGVTLSLDALAFDAAARRRRRASSATPRSSSPGGANDLALAALFAEELGAVLQVRAARPRRGDGRAARRRARRLQPRRRPAQRARRDPHHAQQPQRCSREQARSPAARLERDHAAACRRCATTRNARARNTTASSTPDDPGFVAVSLTFRGEERLRSLPEARPRSRHPARAGRERPGGDGGGLRPRRLRVGRRAHDRPHRRARDARGLQGLRRRRRLLLRRRARRRRRAGRSTILFNARARAEFERFFARSDTFALGACNGCQMMAAAEGARSRRRSTGRCSCATAPSSSRRAS